jgi:hypothetical protein
MNRDDAQAGSVKASENDVNVERANASGMNQNRLHDIAESA